MSIYNKFACHLRAVLILLALGMPSNSLRAQSNPVRNELNPDDFGGVMVTVYVPPDIDTRARALLSTRLGQVASSGGLSGVQMRSRFVLFPRLTVLDETTAGGLEKMVTTSVEVTFEVRNLDTRVPVHQWTATVAGTGRDKDAAVMQAISSIKAGTPALSEFARETHDRIVSYYDQNCTGILQEATISAKAGRFDEAFATLLTVPVAATGCHDRAMGDAQRIASEWERTDCTQKMNTARRQKVSGDFVGAADELIAIGPGSACSADAVKLTRELDAAATARENDKLRVKLKTLHELSTTTSTTVSVSASVSRGKIAAAAFFNRAESRVIRLDALK